MGLIEIFLIALGLSMDAFAVSICLGLDIEKATIKKMLIIGAYFGFFQGIMPIIGYYLARLFADKIIAFDHWIAFGLLTVLGAKMILESFSKQKGGCTDRKCPTEICADRPCPGQLQTKEMPLTPAKMLPYAVATSIDALAIGVSFAFLDVQIFTAASVVLFITFVLSMVGVKIGNIFGTKIKSKAEIVGGAILILIGLKILLEHLGVINF